MDRPPLHSNQAPTARRRIVPVAVTHDEHANACNNNDFNQPLVVPPPPATGNSKDISKYGPGRRVFVNIDNKVEVKWKEVLRQQGLDITTWRKQRDQKLAQLEAVTGAQGAAKRRDVTGLLAKKHQQLYEESNGSEGGSDEEDEGESGEGDEGEGEEGDGAASSGEHDEEEDDAEDDEEEEKEGNETGGEVDLEKEAEAEQQQAKAKRKRQRFERYDDDFIDDSELETVKMAAQAKTKFSGFYVTQGGVETIEEAPKPRAKPKPRHPKTTDVAAATGAAAAAAGGPGRKRKQPAQQQQQDQQELETGGEPVPKKKRQRSETPANVAAAAVSQDPKPAAGRKAKPSPVPPPADAAQAAGAGAGPGSSAAAEAAAAGLPPAPPAAAAAAGGSKSTAQMALAAAMAAKNKKAAPAAGSQSDISGSTAAAAQSPPPPAAVAAAEAAGAKGTSWKTAQDASKQQHEAVPAQQPADTLAAGQDGTAASAAAVLAAAAPTPTKATPSAGAPAEAAATKEATSKADTANRDAAEAAAAAAGGGAVAAAKAAGLPADVVAAVEALQKAVAEHKPAAPGTSSSAANMSKAVKTVLDALGVTFARQSHQVREQHAAALVSVLAPLMLPYMKEKKLRRLVLEEPLKKAEALDNTKAALMAELEQVAGQKQATGSADGANDDFQAQLSTAAADALVAAWTAAKDVPDVLNQLALDVCSKLGWSQVQGSPSKAVAELLPVVKKAKKRLSKHKQHSQPTSGRQSPEPAEAAAATVDGPAAAAAAAASDVAGGAPGATPKKRGGSSNLDNQPALQHVMTAPMALAAAAGSGSNAAAAAAAAAPSASQKLSQKQDKEKEHWSQFGAPSPRLQRCVEAAVAAGADRQWLSDKYATLKGSYMHQAFRTLCMSGPQGCLVPDFVARAAQHHLGFSGEDNKTVRRAVKQSLQTITMTNIVGVTEADPKAFALLCFSGVQQQPAKTSKAAADASGGQQGTQATAE